MVNDPQYWQPSKPSRWDWGAGLFTRMCADHLQDQRPQIHTVDISGDAIAIARTVTAEFFDFICYHQMTSEAFLETFDGQIDLLYMDTGETGEEAAQLHLREATIVLSRELLTPRAIVLVDDVDVTPRGPSKGEYSIPYLCQHGFDIIRSDYQVLLQKRGNISNATPAGSASSDLASPWRMR